MNKIDLNYTKATFCVCGLVFLCAVGARASTLPLDPNNAALLYYQAVALWSDMRSSYAGKQATKEPGADIDTRPDRNELKSSDETMALVEKMMRQYEREHEEESREASRQAIRQLTIQLIEAASRIPRCTWGKREWGLPALGSLRHIALLLEDDCAALVAAGDYQGALERCLTIRRFARHLGDERIILHNMSLMVDEVAFRGVRNVLNSMPPNAEVLTWLKGQPEMSQGSPAFFVRALDINLQHAIENLQRSPKTVARIRNRIAGEATALSSEEVEEELRSITDDMLIPEIQKQASSISADFLDSVREAIESNKPYDQTYMEIELLTYKLRVHDFLVPFYDLTGVMITPDFYRMDVDHKTMMNATKAAIEIYLARAKTSELPDGLPDGVPKDPYTCRNFGYEVMDEGFALRCQGEEFQKGRMRRMLEFKVGK